MAEKKEANAEVILGKLPPLKIRTVPLFVGFAAAMGPV